jgi:hypothetical protein
MSRKVVFRIAKIGKDTSSAIADEIVLDTTQETLPIEITQPWKIVTIGPDFSSNFATNYAYIYHGLDYVPIFKAWVEIPVTINSIVKHRKFRIPYYATNNFGYTAHADEEKITITSGFAAPDYPGSTFEVNGFVYIFDKKFEFKS